MLKIAALLFNSIALLFYQLFFVDGVTITPKLPETAQVGSEFIVEMEVNKGTNSGFAKFQQELPPGFTAFEVESNGGSFTFINQSVKIIWMSLPTDATYKISYKVKVSAEALGKQILSGKFSFVSDNVKQTTDIPEISINITNAGETPVATNQTLPSTENPMSAETTATPVVPDVKCTRVLPKHAMASKGFIVEVTVLKGNLTGFAKLSETLPQGFTAIGVDYPGAIFSFEDQKATFVFGSMPRQPEFKVYYKVVIDPETNGEKGIEGVFSFVENEQTLKYVLAPGFIDVVGTVATKKEESPKVLQEVVPEQSTTNNETPKELSATNVPAPQTSGNVNYRIQILALRKARNLDLVRSYYKIKESLSLEMAGGYTKYIAGSHQEYKSAHDARERYKIDNGITAPFVVAYNSGKRITVQEALMITKQQWYK